MALFTHKSSLNPTDVRPINPISVGKVALTESRRNNGRNVGVRKAAVPMALSALCAALGGCIPTVVGLRSERKVSRVDARRVVAGVHNNEAVCDRAIYPLPSISMRPHRALSWHEKNSVSVSVLGSSPEPAASALVDPGLKHIFRAENRKGVKFSPVVGRVVTTTAELPSYCGTLPTRDTWDDFSHLVAHRRPRQNEYIASLCLYHGVGNYGI